MAEVSALPASGGVLFDARNDGRSLRIGWHPAECLVVFSLWRTNRCVATCQLSRTDAAALVAELASGLAATPPVPPPPWTAPTYGHARALWLRRFTRRSDTSPRLRAVPTEPS